MRRMQDLSAVVLLLGLVVGGIGVADAQTPQERIDLLLVELDSAGAAGSIDPDVKDGLVAVLHDAKTAVNGGKGDEARIYLESGIVLLDGIIGDGSLIQSATETDIRSKIADIKNML